MGKVNDNDWINKELQTSIATVLNKSSEDVTKTSLYALRELDLSDFRIKDLTGIEYAKNLSSLVLNNNKLKNIEVLEKLSNLKNLELNNNNIEDMSCVKKLKKLKSLSIEFNNLTTVPNLSDLKLLTLLNISNNSIHDFSFIDNLFNTQIKILATEQLITLNPIYTEIGSEITLPQYVNFEKDTKLYCDDIQVSGDFDELITDEKDYFLYSVSKITLNNIRSNCVIKSFFYHESIFAKAIILSGVLIQPILISNNNASLHVEKLDSNLYSITGKLLLNDSQALKSKVVTIIDSDGYKLYSTTNESGIFTFNSLKEDRYTLLFPFLNDYSYITPSLYVINLKDNRAINIDAYVSNKIT